MRKTKIFKHLAKAKSLFFANVYNSLFYTHLFLNMEGFYCTCTHPLNHHSHPLKNKMTITFVVFSLFRNCCVRRPSE
jgi:hypothetical protein